MEINIFDFISDLEKDIAELYSRLKSLNKYPQSMSVFDFMNAHSLGHAEQVSELRDKHLKPKINNTFYLEIYKKIKDSCYEEIRNSNCSEEAMEILARTEEHVGKMYHLLSEHYKKLSDYYKNISIDIETLEQEEYNHRDILLKEKDSYK